MRIGARYKINKAAVVGDELVCPSCGTRFIKKQHQQAFCRTKPGTQCKDKYWNTVTPTKRNNTTRISPANQAWRERNLIDEFYDDDIHMIDEVHPHDIEGNNWMGCKD